MKKTFLNVTGACCMALAIFFSSCNNDTAKTADTKEPAFSLDSAKAVIAANNKTYGECFAKGDSTAFAGCYTTDGCIYPPNMPKMCGSQALSGFFVGGYKMGIRNIKLTTEEVMGGKDAVTEVGKYEVLGDKDMSFDKGKYIVIWKEENGKWKMHRDEWNSDMPMAMPK